MAKTKKKAPPKVKAKAKKPVPKVKPKKVKAEKPLDLDNPAVRGTVTERIGVEEWAQKLKKEGFKDIYTKTATDGSVPIGTKGYNADEFGEELERIFPGNNKPEIVAVDKAKKKILVGDITARSSTTATLDESWRKRRLPNDLEDEDFTRHHLDKTKRDAYKLSDNLSEKYGDYEIHFQDKYSEDPDRAASARFKVKRKPPLKTSGSSNVERGIANGKPDETERATKVKKKKTTAPKKKTIKAKEKKTVPEKKSKATTNLDDKEEIAKKSSAKAKKKSANKVAQSAEDEAAEKLVAKKAAKKAATETEKKAAEKAIDKAKGKAAEKAAEKAAKEAEEKAVTKVEEEVAEKSVKKAEEKALEKALVKSEKKGLVKLALKFRPKIKGGLFFILQIGFDLFLGWLESKHLANWIESVLKENSSKFQELLDNEKVQDDFIKFRTDEELENGYQLYFKIDLFITRTCSDGGCGFSGRISNIQFKEVSFTRNKGDDFMPDPEEEKGWGVSYNGMYGAYATFYSPIFEKGEIIHKATEDAADEDLKYFEEFFVLHKGKATGDYQKEYFDEFRKYAMFFPDSKANLMYNLQWGLNDTLVAVTYVELGRKSSMTLMDSPINMSFDQVIETVRWGLANKIQFILDFYNIVITLNDEWKIFYLELYDKYFRLMDDSLTKCQYSCHKMNADKRLIRRITADDVRKSQNVMRGLNSSINNSSRGINVFP
jgi:hypothetical protein